MRTFCKGFLLCILMLPIGSRAQLEMKYNSIYSSKNNIIGFNLNLKDSVKAVYVKFSAARTGLSDHDIATAKANNFIINNAFLGFDENQRIVQSVGDGYIKEEYLSFADIQENNSNHYLYYKKDIARKNKYKTPLKQYYPLYNYNLLLKPDQTLQVQLKRDGRLQVAYMSRFYVYRFDDEGRITEEKLYSEKYDSKTRSKVPKEEDLDDVKQFVYNDKGQVISQKISAGTKDAEFGSSYNAMGTKSRFCKDLELKYQYDSKGRITQIEMFGCYTVAGRQEYIYHPDRDYVQSVKIYTKDGSAQTMGRRNILKTYNEQGDLINIKALVDNPAYYPQSTLDKLQKYFKYQYDSHNNWIRCEMYLEGTDQGEPTLTAERKIEYFL